MREKILLALFVFIAGLEESAGQERQILSPSISPTPGRGHKTFVFRRNQKAVSGYFAGIAGDTLILFSGGRREKVLRKDLRKVVVNTERNFWKSGTYGMLVGIYLGNLIFFQADNQPTAYLESGKEILPPLALFAGVGGGMGYLFGSTLQQEKTFDFTGSEVEKQKSWGKLHRLSRNEIYANKIHLTIQAAQVYPRASKHYKNQLEHAGFNLGYPPGKFNLLRKMQFTISATTATELGAAVLWFGEPAIGGFRYEDGVYVYHNVIQQLEGRGVYALGIYHPLGGQRQKRYRWQVGVGAGMAKVNFSLNARSYRNSPLYDVIVSTRGLAKTVFSGMVFTGFNFHFSKNLSLGLIADYAYAPPERAPAVAEAKIPAQKLRLGNASLGLTTGLHF